MIQKHLGQERLETADPYDVWNMKLGQAVKKIYYKNKILGIVPAAILTVFDFYINNNIRLWYSPRQYPIVHAYLALIGLELHKKTREQEYLDLSKRSLEWLSKNYSKNYSGYCWGINMPWVSKIAIYDEEVPHITHTAYILEAFINFQLERQTTEYDEIIDSLFMFLEIDLNKMIDTVDTLALSYSSKDETRIVINANSYAMLCYALLYGRNSNWNTKIEDNVKRLYNFLFTNQNENGSWFYYADKATGNFIDCFHSCFVMKNLYKVNKIISLPNCHQVIAKGYSYLKQFFWNDSIQLFKRFSITDRVSLVKYDLYDNAEMLNLAIFLQDQALIKKLCTSIERNFVVGTDVYSNIIFPNLKINRNTLRWATLPYLYALSKTL